jgi:mannose-6-phosphate isomerase-like protein (cupin superfamily)
MEGRQDYVIQTDIAFGGLDVFDVHQLVNACPHPWFNQTLCQVNDAVVRLGIFEGTFHFHKHDVEDELFYVVEGNLRIDLEDRTVNLAAGQGMLVPRGVIHCPSAEKRTVVLMVEAATVTPVGDSAAA